MSTATGVSSQFEAAGVADARASREAGTSERRWRRFEAQTLPHLRSLYLTALRSTGNARDAQDLVQDTLLRAFRAFEDHLPGPNIRARIPLALLPRRPESASDAQRLEEVM